MAAHSNVMATVSFRSTKRAAVRSIWSQWTVLPVMLRDTRSSGRICLSLTSQCKTLWCKVRAECVRYKSALWRNVSERRIIQRRYGTSLSKTHEKYKRLMKKRKRNERQVCAYCMRSPYTMMQPQLQNFYALHSMANAFLKMMGEKDLPHQVVPTTSPPPKVEADTSDASDYEHGANNDDSAEKRKRERRKKQLARLIEAIKHNLGDRCKARQADHTLALTQ